MVSRKTVIRRAPLYQNAKYASDTAHDSQIEIVQARLQASEILSLADENDNGTDPYNSTGQYAVLGALKKR